ncbi:hypothetical protein [Serpentinicella alkaliphila]|uniref:Uncharacterized protein n=1 Tax=Serpentinicella alkaliphila TaxID=1734049 RepID=A0A4R2TW44_9FIRM|nr:hypothetical protein [Serpentinicella alkaliphila]QUH26944.1 hypothetical protein HZR23_15245 [Serpentinicella alkaliphila]TCQ08181.1 hypothetical protein EDD79_1001273 [Serpentinicella alkaliphila]
MAQIIELDNYRILKQTEIIAKIYNLLNKSLNNRLDSVVWQFDDSFYSICKKYELDLNLIKYFRIPVITFIVTLLIKNSVISEYFPKDVLLENDDNLSMFKASLIKIIESVDKNYSSNYNKILVEYQLEKLINKQFDYLMLIIPQRIKIN